MGKQLVTYMQYNMTKAEVEKKKQKFSDFAGYINNDKKNEYSFVDYIDNKRKVEMKPFNEVNDLIEEEQLEEYKSMFDKIQERDGILYQGVFSFDHDLLLEQGLINEEGEVINIQALKVAIQKGIKELKDNSKIANEDFVCVANFHFNTKHIHCHIGYVDRNDYHNKYDGLVTNSKTFKKAISVVTNHLTRDLELLKNIAKLRDDLRKEAKSIDIDHNDLIDIYMKVGKKIFNGYNGTHKVTNEAGTIFKVNNLSNEEKEYVKDKVIKLIESDEDTKTMFDEFNNFIKQQNDDINKAYSTKDKSSNAKLDEVITSFAHKLVKEMKEINREDPEFFKKQDELRKRFKNLNFDAEKRELEINVFKNKFNLKSKYNPEMQKVNSKIKGRLKYLANKDYYSRLQINLNYYENVILNSR